eukprot:CAMPEP_0173440952 /NCGR_PEP_ID=MMETSP1357-20121228/23694_1 /TAXON_ID=77926 /ORGANISM="Hemiselmis rufescens, Strain PCC563" /LENGTH=427 /DNA_ID=CAMNT_0014406493 /DNA_START=8 /DNA_END=1291 /DNA_ORIENTATION=-
MGIQRVHLAVCLAVALLGVARADGVSSMPLKSSDPTLSAQQAQGAQNQGSGTAFIDPTSLVAGNLGRVQSATSLTRTCPRPLTLTHESQLVGRPAPSLSSLQRAQNSRRVQVALGKRTAVSMQADSFDPLGLTSGMGSEGDIDTAIVQKQLWTAAKSGDVEGLESAVTGGADVNFKYPDEGDATALQAAALTGNSEAAAKLVSLGADVNAVDKYGWAPLHDAALNGHTDTVAKLAELGAKIDAKTSDVEDEAPGAGGRTALTNAAMNGHTATVEKLVALGADVNARQKDGWTALHLAAKNGWDATVEKLVKLGIDVNVRNDADMSALHYAAWDATVETCMKLVELGVDVGHKAQGKMSALHLAEKRMKEKAGRKVAEALREAMGVTEEEEAGPGDDVDAPWASRPDGEWRKLIANDPYAKSTDGMDF